MHQVIFIFRPVGPTPGILFVSGKRNAGNLERHSSSSIGLPYEPFVQHNIDCCCCIYGPVTMGRPSTAYQPPTSHLKLAFLQNIQN